MSSFSSLYNRIYEHNAKNSEYITNFRKNPYSYVKARYYFFTANIIVYLLQNINFNPRLISFFYILQGFIAMILLNVENQTLNLVAIFLFFSKGTLDWADGHYARLKNQTSLTGHILDIYGARLNSVFFLISLGFYQYLKYENIYFLFMVILLPIFMLGYFEKYAYQLIFNNFGLNKFIKNSSKKKFNPGKDNKFFKVKYLFLNILDDRSRSIDFILLCLIIEIYFEFKISYILFFFIFVKWLIIWLYSLFFHTSMYWAENIISQKEKDIFK